MKEQMMKQSGNIVEFNDWMRQQVSQLHAHGEEATDLLAYLWNMYLTTPNKECGDYSKSLHNKYEDSRANYTGEHLMTLAEQKNKGRVLSGELGSLSEVQAEIVALTAKIDVQKQELKPKNTEEQKKKKGNYQAKSAKDSNGAGRRSPWATRHPRK